MGALGTAVVTSDLRFELTSDEKHLVVDGTEHVVSRHEMTVRSGQYAIYFCRLDSGKAFAVIRGEQKPDTLLELDWMAATCFAEHNKTAPTLWMIFAAYGKQAAKA
jgi:hypothetical protein